MVIVNCTWEERFKLPETPVTVTVKLPTGVLALFVVTVMTEEPPLLPGVTLSGANAQKEAEGSPEQERAMELANDPPSGMTLTEKRYELPRAIVALLGVTLTR